MSFESGGRGAVERPPRSPGSHPREARLAQELDARAIAIHEAGHAVVAHLLGEPVIGMLIDESHGSTGITPPPAHAQRAHIERVAAIYLAGPIALAKYREVPSVSFAANGDLLGDVARATELVGRITGIGPEGISEVLRVQAERAGKLLRDGEAWALVERLASELIAKGGLTQGDVAALVPLAVVSR